MGAIGGKREFYEGRLVDVFPLPRRIAEFGSREKVIANKCFLRVLVGFPVFSFSFRENHVGYFMRIVVIVRGRGFAL